MAVDIGSTHTFVELAKRHKNKELLDIAYSINRNPIISDAQWFEANGLDSHTHTKANSAGLPSASVRLVNEGVDPTTGQTSQVVENIIDLEDRSEIDEKLVNRATSPEEYRYNEDMLHLEGMSRKFMTEFFNGNPGTTVGDLSGLIHRYSDTGLSNVFDEGGSGSNCSSIWVIRWGLDGVHFVYPKNSKTIGFEREDQGRELITSSGTKRYYAFVTLFQFSLGLVVRKDAAVQRLGNIDSSNTVDVDNLIDMLANVEEEYGDLNNTVCYMGRSDWVDFNVAAKNAGNVLNTTQDPFGKPQYWFRGVQVKMCGGITRAESAI